MVKSFLILIICQIFIYANEQIILVVGDNYNSKKAVLSCFENGVKIFDSFEVNVGKNGFGLGVGERSLSKTDTAPIKYEGDKKSPIGVFSLDSVFGYKRDLKTKMPYLHATDELICVDDSDSPFYNQIIKKGKNLPKSFENMRRDDFQYELGVFVGHNKEQLAKRGSCIFLHVEKAKGEATAGCSSMKLEDIKKIVSWLDKSKNPILLQVTKKELEEVLKLYPALKF